MLTLGFPIDALATAQLVKPEGFFALIEPHQALRYFGDQILFVSIETVLAHLLADNLGGDVLLLSERSDNIFDALREWYFWLLVFELFEHSREAEPCGLSDNAVASDVFVLQLIVSLSHRGQNVLWKMHTHSLRSFCDGRC